MRGTRRRVERWAASKVVPTWVAGSGLAGDMSGSWTRWLESMRGADRDDDVANGLAGCGGVALIVDERYMRGLGVPVDAVGRQGGQVVLRRSPCRVVAAVGGEDDQRLVAQANQG